MQHEVGGGTMAGEGWRAGPAGGMSQTGTWRCEACGAEFRSRSEWEEHGRAAHDR